MINLTEIQNSHIKTVEWLLSPHDYLREGRSTVMMVAYTNILFDNIGCEIKIVDHSHSYSGTERLIRGICEIITSKGYDFELSWNNSKIKITRKLW